MQPGFAVWITGLPASGKSTVAAAVVRELAARGVAVAVLESDALRRVFTPHPCYSDEERDVFYGAMVHVGRLLAEHGVPVIFDATGNRRAYRDRARRQIPRFVEVYVDCPLEVCMARDPKGIYRRAREGAATTVPGVQAVYEPPAHPEVLVRGDGELPNLAARQIVATLVDKGYLTG
ncbi:MAG: adenylyl-sulfate kinase [Candidatus Methylomirabilales bacterium]